MKNVYTKYLLLTATLLILGACSTRKNTWLSRNYQAMTTRYNVYFNGKEAYLKGVEKTENSLQDDYTNILPLFTYHDHDNLKSAKSDMERATEKSMKAIKKHSIKKKPTPKNKSEKMRDPKYREWYDGEEFNPMVPKAYMLMGQASFYKGEFLESIGVFNYVVKHFGNYEEHYDAQLWMARGYAEMGWLYEAENELIKIADDEQFPAWKEGEYSKVRADLLMKQEKYSDAIPYLKRAITAETDKSERRRMTFILAQIYQRQENYENAVANYEKVLKLSPSYEMAFNTRIRLTEVVEGADDTESIEKQLKKMLKDSKNDEYQDQIYYALANIELGRNNEDEAIAYLHQSVEVSSKNPVQKARSLVQLADLYYQKDEFRQAQPYYSQAASIIKDDFPDYGRINELARILDKLADHLSTIDQKDSLIRVAQMSESERNKVIDGLIKDAVYRAEHPEVIAEDGDVDPSMNLSKPSNWYFYNASVVESGKSAFRKQWGNRKLEDNWRRTQKDAVYADIPEAVANDYIEKQQEEVVIPEDQTAEYYLKDLPLTEEQMQQSKADLGVAYVGAGSIYKDNLKSLSDAEDNFDNLLTRLPEDPHALEAKFGLYQVYTETGRTAEAEKMKQDIVSNYPNTKYAIMLSNPNYAEELAKDVERRDSLYTDTYEAYMEGDYNRMFANVNQAYEQYPNSEIQPNFMFMEALAISKTGEPELFEKKLLAIKEQYPKSDVVPHVDNIIGLMKEGLLPSRGGTGGPMGVGVDSTYLAQYEEVSEVTTDEKPLYSEDLEARHYFVIIHPEQELDKNQLLYELSRFNFNRFLVKDFDISFIKLNRWYNMLVINGFDGVDEAFWYRKTILEDGLLNDLITSPGVKEFVISDENFKSLAAEKNADAYEEFYKQIYKPLQDSVENPYLEE